VEQFASGKKNNCVCVHDTKVVRAYAEVSVTSNIVFLRPIKYLQYLFLADDTMWRLRLQILNC